MKRNIKFFGPLTVLLTVLMLFSAFILPGSIQPVRADSSLPDQAVAFLKADYENYGAEHDLSIHYPYVAYILDSAGVNWENWEYKGVSLKDAVDNIVDADINDSTAPVKYLAQDLILMQAMGDTVRSNQLEDLLRTRQCQDGTFQDDNNAFSIIPAYELLGRADSLSIVNTVYASDYILKQQDTSIGAWTNVWADFMSTAQAVRALNYLEPQAASSSPAGQAVSQGLSWLKQLQQSDGSFKTTFDDALIDTAEAIVTQKALGLDPASDWTCGGKSAVDYLTYSSLNSDGSFGDSKTVMDAAWALDSFTLLGIRPSGGGGNSPAVVSVRVQVEGAAGNLEDTVVDVSGTALDALKTAVGSSQVSAPGGFVTSIKGESGKSQAAADTDTAWFFYAIRGGSIDPTSLGSGAGGYEVKNNDQIVFYIGAYDHTTYAPRTYLPVVSLSPQSPSAGQTLTVNIKAQKYDWSSGLQDLTSAEAGAIGEYTVEASGASYTSQNGQAAIPKLSAGSLNYSITNYNPAGYPNVVPYRGTISVAAGGSGGSSASSAVSVGVAVVGKNSEILYGPGYATIDSTNQWGNTVLGALEATGLPYTTSGKYSGFVDSIAGQSNSGQQGWMYTLNGKVVMQSAKDASVSDGDRVIWYFSQDLNQAAPKWADLISGSTTGLTPVNNTTGKADVNPAAGGTVGQGTDAWVEIPPGALTGSSPVQIAVTMLSAPPPAPSGFMLLGQAYEFTVDGRENYTFSKPVTLSFTFNAADLLQGQKPSIYYYDSPSSRWVELGGKVSGNIISTSVEHFTLFAVFVNEAKVLAPAAPAPTFRDLSEQHWAKPAITALIEKGAVGGYPDGTFKPENHITRAEVAAILNKALNLPDYNSSTPDFIDVSPEDWFYEPVMNAVRAGIISGYGQNFNPNQEISREELAILLVKALGKGEEARASMDVQTPYTDDSLISGWSRGFVVKALESNLLKGYPDNSFRPQGQATRAEACATIVNLLNII